MALNSDDTQKMEQIAVIGCGRWGKNLARNFYNLEHLNSICDLDEEQLREMRKLYPDINVTNDFQQVLDNPDVDAVVISTPSKTHYPLAMRALEAGKHVYVEKPMATSFNEAEALSDFARRQDLILMVGHLLLYHPAVNRLRQLISEGYLGDIRYIQSDRLNYNPFRQDRSVLWDLAPHDLSMICFLLGKEPNGIVNVNGHRTSQDNLVDVVHIELDFPGGTAGHIHNSWIHPTKQVKLVIRGTERSAVLDDTMESGKILIFRKEDEKTPEREFPEYLTIEPLKLECQHFINCIRYGQQPKTDGTNGNNVVKILEAADKLLQQEEESSSLV